MKKTILTSLAVVILLTAANAMAAQPRAGSVVTGDVLTVGDVFEGAGDKAGSYLGPAPAPGATVTLTTRELVRISRAFSLGWRPGGDGAHVTLRREATDITPYMIQAALQEELAGELQGIRFEMELAGEPAAIRLPAGQAKTLRVENLKADVANARFTAVIAAPADEPVTSMKVSGRLHTLTRIPVLKAPLRAGDIIGSGDIEYVDMRASDISANMIVDAEKMAGMTPRRGVAALKPLTPSDLEEPRIVSKGDIVTVVLNNGTISMTMQARALQSGAKGEIVQVVNTSSSRTLEGVVTGPQTVEIKLPSAAL